MAFNDTQNRALRAKLRYRYVKFRNTNGLTIPYLEGWHAIAEANRIFGHDSWDCITLSPQCLWRETQRGQTACFYSTKVRITVRAGACVIVREGMGTGFGRSHAAELAYEIALKAAETDATKRALATIGNPFGLALYDKDQARVTKPLKRARKAKADDAAKVEPLVLILRSAGGQEQHFEDVQAFVGATLKAVAGLRTIDAIYDFWEENLASFADLRQRFSGSDHDPVAAIVAALKGKLRTLWSEGEAKLISESIGLLLPSPSPEALAIPKEKRLAIRPISALSPASPASSAIAGRRRSTTCGLPKAAPWGARYPTSSRCPCATDTMTVCTGPEMSRPGGRARASSIH